MQFSSPHQLSQTPDYVTFASSSIPQTPQHLHASSAYLRDREFVIPDNLNSRQLATRCALLGWWITTARDYLELKFRTIDIAIKLFDFYCHLKYQKGVPQDRHSDGSKRRPKVKGGLQGHILDCRDESSLTATACFFSSAKFNEIYPPSLNDFIYFEEDKLNKQAVVMREVDIIEVTKCGYTKAIITDWFDLLSRNPLPDWGYRCYLHAPFVKAEDLAHAIYQVVESTNGSSQVECLTKVLELLGVSIPAGLEKGRGKRLWGRKGGDGKKL